MKRYPDEVAEYISAHVEGMTTKQLTSDLNNIFAHKYKYCQEKRGRGLAGYMVDMKITVPLGMDLNEVMEKLSEEWEQTFREKGEE